jgi:hypothetical protein
MYALIYKLGKRILEDTRGTIHYFNRIQSSIEPIKMIHKFKSLDTDVKVYHKYNISITNITFDTLISQQLRQHLLKIDFKSAVPTSRQRQKLRYLCTKASLTVGTFASC